MGKRQRVRDAEYEAWLAMMRKELKEHPPKSQEERTREMIDRCVKMVRVGVGECTGYR